MILQKERKIDMNIIHRFLMTKGFPYHSVSVVYRNDLGHMVFFMEDVEDKVTEAVKSNLKLYDFDYTIVRK